MYKTYDKAIINCKNMATEEDPAFWIQFCVMVFMIFYCIFSISKFSALKITFSAKFSEFHFLSKFCELFLFSLLRKTGDSNYNTIINLIQRGLIFWQFTTFHSKQFTMSRVKLCSDYRMFARWSPCQPIVMYGVCMEYHRSCGPHSNVNHNTQAHTHIQITTY